MERSRTYPVGVDDAFDRLLPAPLPVIFAQRFAILPAIRRADVDGGGPWATPGQTRTLTLSDGTTLREELITVDRPHRFTYRLTDVTGPMRALARSVDGSWSVEPVGTGTRITWRWSLRPTSVVTARLVPAFALLWQGYARRALDRLEPLLLEDRG